MTEAFALVGDVLLPQGRAKAGVVVAGGRVEAVVADPRDGDLPARRRELDGLLAPGFVDLQVNGAFGADVGIDAGALEAISRALPSTGVTAYLPTAISWPADRYASLFDAVERAAARQTDLVLADTAGRLHTKVNLMEELKKVRRVADKPPGKVTEVLLVIDATTGQNGLVQAKQFTEAVEVTGVVLTKLDGTAKGGIVLAIQNDLGIPIKLVGLGETADDLIPFDPDEFIDALFA